MKVDLFGNLIVEEEVEVVKPKPPSPFDYINQISKKEYPDTHEGYAAYIVNLAYSQRKDAVIYANEMNKYSQLSDKAQFDFYFYALPKKNFFSKWAKAMKSDYTNAIMWYFDVSYKVAKQYEKVLKKEQLDTIIEKYNNRKGGK